MTEAAWGSDQYVARFDYGEPEYSSAICTKTPEQQYTAENYGISGYKCGGKPPAWHIPADWDKQQKWRQQEPAAACRPPPVACRPPPTYVWRDDRPPKNKKENLESNPDEICIRLSKQWLFIVFFVLLLTLTTSIGVCYKFMRKLSKHIRNLEKQ